MALTRSMIGGIVGAQIDANMQRHLRGYDPNDFNEQEGKKRPTGENAIRHVLLQTMPRVLYGRISYYILESCFNRCREDIAGFFNELNEEILSSSEFTEAIETQQNIIRKVARPSGHIRVPYDDKYIYGNITIFYIPALQENESNIIRINTIESDKTDHEILTGNIDILDNGEINYNNFYKVSNVCFMKEPEEILGDTPIEDRVDASFEDSVIDMELLDKIREHLVNIMELAGLTTEHRKNL